MSKFVLFSLISITFLFVSCSRTEDAYFPYLKNTFPPLERSELSFVISPLKIEDNEKFLPPLKVEVIPEKPLPPPPVLTVLPEPPEDYVSFTLDGLYEDTILKETPDAGQSYIDGTCYIGDSVTLGLEVFNVLPTEHVFSEGSIDPYAAAHNKIVKLPDGTKITTPQAVGYYKPARVVITLGTNSVSWCSETAFISSYGQLIEDIRTESPSTVIIIQSIPPVSESYEKKSKNLNNGNINRFNYLLCGLAKEKGVYFLNTASVLKNERGYFNDDYQSGDGLHHNTASYKVWINYLKTHAVPKYQTVDQK